MKSKYKKYCVGNNLFCFKRKILKKETKNKLTIKIGQGQSIAINKFLKK